MRNLLLAVLLGLVYFAQSSLLTAADPASIPSTADEKDPILWYSAQDLGLEGKGWTDTKSFYDRFPAKAEGVVRSAVWNLSRDSAGLNVRFIADTKSIAVRWKLTSPSLSMPHMAATGKSGVDLYGRLPNGTWRWIAVGKASDQNNNAVLAAELPPGRREYRVYLPLYNGVSSVEIGLPKDVKIEKVEEKRKPIVFYGTSIMQGACASRTGMAQSSIIGRRLDWPVINLGFSGNAKMEIEVARLLAELDPAVYVLDALPNCGAAEVKERTEPLVLEIRKAHPNTPIVMVEDRTYADSVWNATKLDRNVTSRREYKAAYERLLTAGVKGLTYVEGGQLLDENGEDTVDASHPTDLGFDRYADIMTPIIKGVLPKE